MWIHFENSSLGHLLVPLDHFILVILGEIFISYHFVLSSLNSYSKEEMKTLSKHLNLVSDKYNICMLIFF